MTSDPQQHVQKISVNKTPAERLQLSQNNPLLRSKRTLALLATWLSDQLSLVPSLELIQKACTAVLAHPLTCKFDTTWPSADTRASIVSAKIASEPWCEFSLQQSKGLDAYFTARLIAIRMRPQCEKNPLWFSSDASGHGPLPHDTFLDSCPQAAADAISAYFQKKVPKNSPLFLLECHGHYFVRNGSTGPYTSLNAPVNTSESNLPSFPAELCCHFPSLPGWFPCTLWPVDYSPADIDLGYCSSFAELWPHFDTPPSYSLVPLNMRLVAPRRKKDPLQAKVLLAFVLSPSKTTYISITRPLQSLANDLAALFSQIQLTASFYHTAIQTASSTPTLFDVSLYGTENRQPNRQTTEPDTVSFELRIKAESLSVSYSCTIDLIPPPPSSRPTVLLIKIGPANQQLSNPDSPHWIQEELIPLQEKCIAEDQALLQC